MSSSSAHQPRKSAVDQQPTTANVNLETELELALEFSRQTFMEEEAKRVAAEHHSADLIVIEDPALIERNRQVEQIKQLLKNSSVASPNSPPPFTNPFLPLMLANNSRISATSVVQQPFSAPASYAAPSASAHHHFCLPSTSSQTSFECSQLNLVTLFPTPETTTAQAFPNRFPKAAPFNNGSTSTIGQQQQPLFIHANLNTLKQDGACLASPLKVPFRQGDLIDLNSPGRNVVRSMELEEFDPLYKKLEIMRSQQEVEETEKSSKNEANGEEQNEDGQAPTSSITSSPPGQPELTKAIQEENPKETRPIPIPRMSRQMTQHRLLTCEDLKANCELVCDFYKEKQLLSECAAQLALPKNRNVFFQSPVLDYFVTTVDTIKLQVHQDDSWARDTPDEPRRLELACDVRSCSEEILVDVLLRLLPQEEIARNQGHIPLADYVLKVFGTDEFLDRNAPIGKHPFVADFLAKGRDVELEVGRYQLPMTPTASRMPKMSATAFPIVNKDLFNTFIQTLTSHVEKCLTSPEDKKLRQPVLQSIKMITTFMNNTQSTDLLAALDLLYSANCTTSLQEAVNFIVASLIRLFRAYCRSSLTDFSVPDPLEPSPAPMPETRDSALCNEKLLLSVESAHNLPGLYAAKYKAFFLEAHLMYGPKSFGMCVSPARPLTTKYNTLHFVPVQLWVDFDVHISSLPRETQVCFILRGVPIVTEPESTGAGEPQPTCDSTTSSGYASVRNSANSENGIFAHQLASASLPLYNVDDLLLQGPLLLPLRQMEDDVVQPWGPRPLVRQPDDIILVVKALEFEYRIQFPSQIALSGMLWREFDTLPAGDRESLQTMIDGAVSHQLADDDREFLWSNRHYLHRFPRALPLVLSSSFSWGTYSLGNIYALIEHWAPLPPDVALELLLPYFQDKKVRKKALESLAEACSDFLLNLITQFVEALRYECLENSALALFLLEQSTKDRRFAFELFWQLQHRILETKSPSYAARCQLLRQMLLELNIPGFENEVVFQQIFLDRLDRISTAVKGSAEANMTKTLHKQLFQLSDELDMENVRIPVAPSFRCKSIAVAECSIFNSLSKPMKIMVKGKRSSFGIIYKVGDDLRQDAVVIQLVRAMNNIWLAEQLDLRMILFRCLPTGSRKGLIELVPNCSTLREIQIQMGSGVAGVYRDDVLANWLARQNPSEFQYKAALENFRRSCAGWCVATYVLGIGDRHNDNILVTKNGHVFHIDFGKYMGDWQMAAGFKRDRVPFVFTPEMAFLINGGQSSTEHFQRFVDECCQGLNLLRKNCSMVLNIMRFLSCSEIPGMSMESVNFVENNLMLDLNDVQATVLFTRMIEESLQSRFPRLNFFAHTLAQFKGNPLQISGVTKTEDMNRLSFISEIYTEQAEGRIESVLVNSYEKWQENGRKIYMYKLLVKRRNENVNSQIYRSFQEFQELHWKLCYRFSSRAIPSLSHTVNVGRTNIRAVAVRRQVELQYFLQRLFALADEVSHSELVYTFLHPLYRDTEPETRKLNGMPDIWADADSQCQLLLRISLDEPNAELRIFVGHAKNLPLVGRVQAPDSYAKIYLRWKVSQQEKQWKRKTQVVRNAQNPTYNTEICYSLADNQRHHLASSSASRLSQLTSLDISIWHSGNAVLKDNFPLCETRIHLNQLEECRPNRKGVKELESWFNLETSYS